MFIAKASRDFRSEVSMACPAAMTLLSHCPNHAGLPRSRPCQRRSPEAFALQSIGAQLGSLALFEERAMARGTVKWFNASKGFGFIQPDAGGADVFVHISAVERAGLRDLHERQKIAYEVVADRRTGKSSADNLKSV